MRKPDFCLGKNKGADQLRGNREADQRLCFGYSDSTIPLLPESEIQASSLFLRLCRPVCVGRGQRNELWISLNKLWISKNRE